MTQSPKNLQSDQREPAWRPAPAVSAAEMPYNIFHYVLETSGWHQLWLVVFTVAVFLLEIVPLELQRRIVNDLPRDDVLGSHQGRAASRDESVRLRGSPLISEDGGPGEEGKAAKPNGKQYPFQDTADRVF